MRSLFSITAFLVLWFSNPTGLHSEPISEEILAGFFSTQRPATSKNAFTPNEIHPAEISKALGGIENLRISSFPGGAILQGELLTADDLLRVKTLSENLGGIINLCTLHKDALEISAEYIRKQMLGMGISDLEITVVGSNLFLSGTPASADEVARVGKICQSYNLPFIDGTAQNISDSRMVLFEVSFTELNHQAFRELGVSWPSSLTFTDPTGIRLDRLEPAQPLELTLNMMIQQGKGRIISKPRLVCRSGEEASFQAGGEIPIPNRDSEGQISITWKRYGIILDVSPNLDSKGRIHTRVSSEVSMIDRANSFEGVPGILTRKINTFLSLRRGQTIMLSGLVNKEDGEEIKKVPLFGDIPVLGELFRSTSIQARKSELIVLITPYIISPEALPGFPVDIVPAKTSNHEEAATLSLPKQKGELKW